MATIEVTPVSVFLSVYRAVQQRQTQGLKEAETAPVLLSRSEIANQQPHLLTVHRLIRLGPHLNRAA